VAFAILEPLVRLQIHARSLTLPRAGCLRARSSHTRPAIALVQNPQQILTLGLKKIQIARNLRKSG
jgi:hypothetical protein